MKIGTLIRYICQLPAVSRYEKDFSGVARDDSYPVNIDNFIPSPSPFGGRNWPSKAAREICDLTHWLGIQQYPFLDGSAPGY